MRHGSLFSGIGAPELAAEWMGWTNVFHCEWNEFSQKVLKKNFPNSKGYANIKDFDATEYRGLIDIISGGFPCQPYSVAGKQKGKDDDRHLWPEMLRIIREVQPSWVVGENVLGLVNWNGGLVFEEVQADLEAAGYEVQPFILPAAGVNAPHERYRVWFIAYSNSYANRNIGKQDREADGLQGNGRQEIFTGQPIGANTGDVMHTNDTEQQGQRIIREGKRELNGSDRGNYERPTWGRGLSQPAICRGNDGIPNRVDRVIALGNSMVPQVVYQIFKAIEQYHQLTII